MRSFQKPCWLTLDPKWYDRLDVLRGEMRMTIDDRCDGGQQGVLNMIVLTALAANLPRLVVISFEAL